MRRHFNQTFFFLTLVVVCHCPALLAHVNDTESPNDDFMLHIFGETDL